MPYRLSVIIPVYKVEKYINRCAHSLFCQTMQDIEYIFVNDCTPDDSVRLLQSIIDEYPKRKPHIKITSHKKNMGSGVARNTGLTIATAPYIIYCDGDDWVEPDMYEVMYKKACEDNADIVMCDYYEEKKGERIYCSQNPYNYKEDIIEQMLVGRIHSSVWGRLVRKSLFDDNSIRFPEGINMWEDLATSVQLHYFAGKVSHIQKAFYHYIQYNSSSLVNIVSIKIVNDKILACEIIKDFFVQQKELDKYTISLNHLMLISKMDFVFSDCLYDFNKWRKVFPVSNKFVWRVHIPFHVKLILSFVDKGFDNVPLVYMTLKKGYFKILSIVNEKIC